MRELEGKYYLAENERDYDGYMKKYEKDMEFYEKKLEEVGKSDKINKEDEKILFDNDAIEEYAKKVNEEMEKEMANVQAESDELHKKIQEEEEGNVPFIQKKWWKILKRIRLKQTTSNGKKFFITLT
jgi:hypothetical protein